MTKLIPVSFYKAVDILNKANRAIDVLNQTLPEKVVGEILDKGLADSTWQEEYPAAYTELLTYRKDFEESVRISIKDWSERFGGKSKTSI